MRIKILIIVCSIMLQACGTMRFDPAEYPLRDGLIPTLNVKGNVSVTNSQPSNEPTIVYSYMGSKLSSDLNSITEVMVQQTSKELTKNGEKTSSAAVKTIELKVNSLLSKYTNAFFWKSKLEFEASLGNGETVSAIVPHSSGVLAQDLNGCIAESVVVLLNDDRVKQYLSE